MLTDGEYDAIIMGTGLTECIISGLLSVNVRDPTLLLLLLLYSLLPRVSTRASVCFMWTATTTMGLMRPLSPWPMCMPSTSPTLSLLLPWDTQETGMWTWSRSSSWHAVTWYEDITKHSFCCFLSILHYSSPIPSLFIASSGGCHADAT